LRQRSEIPDPSLSERLRSGYRKKLSKRVAAAMALEQLAAEGREIEVIDALVRKPDASATSLG